MGLTGLLTVLIQTRLGLCEALAIFFSKFRLRRWSGGWPRRWDNWGKRSGVGL